MRGYSLRTIVLFVCTIVVASPCFGQGGEVLPRLGVGAKFSTLGFGIEAATAVTQQSNVRGGLNTFTYDRGFFRDGINYDTQVLFRSVEAHFDWFVGHGFHLSPGLLVYNNNRVEGAADVPAGQSFTLGGHSYVSSAADPVKGNAQIDFSKTKVAPMITAGFGNLLRRGGRRFTVTMEAGVAFGSSPNATLNLTGSACAGPSGPCQNVASTPQIQSDIASEQNKINNGQPPYDVFTKVLKYYPVVSIGVGYRFK
jgi:hypothetical protein